VGDEHNTVGLPILPADLNRVLGNGFATLDQIRRRSGITVEQVQKARDFLVERGMFVAWYAAKCPACLYTWPVCRMGEEDTVNRVITCPICNRATKRKNVVFYDVYEVIK
jgi:NAD-dependent SIR2 family protein deacetylase